MRKVTNLFKNAGVDRTIRYMRIWSKTTID